MSASQQDVAEPGPEALAYGSALREIVKRQSLSQGKFAATILLDSTVLSRHLSGQRIADRATLDRVVDAVRKSAHVGDDEVAELHCLRQAAQTASSSQKVRLAALQEQMDEVKAVMRSFRSQVQNLEGANRQLADRVDGLLRRVVEEEEHADRERSLRLAEQERRQRAVEAAEASAAELNVARSQLSAASEYTRESDAVLKEQREELRFLRQEVKVLRDQVQRLHAEAGDRATQSVAGPASQVSGLVDRSDDSEVAVSPAYAEASVTSESLLVPAPLDDVAGAERKDGRQEPYGLLAERTGVAEVPVTVSMPSLQEQIEPRQSLPSSNFLTERAAISASYIGPEFIEDDFDDYRFDRRWKRRSRMRDSVHLGLSFILITILGVFLRATIVAEKLSLYVYLLLAFNILLMLLIIILTGVLLNHRYARIYGTLILSLWGLYFIAVSPWFAAPSFITPIDETMRELLSR